jgi:hypothetical protein
MRPVRGSGAGAVYWLTAQTVVFGVVAAVLGVVANAMFLQAYGASWLPLTYVLIGVAGAAVSALVAEAARRFDLTRIAVVVLGAAAVLIGAAWLVDATGDGAWVSGPLLVIFPLLIQLGFVFVGAQAGRILDIAGIKSRFPRIMAGFPVGAVLGGVLAARLVDVFGRTDILLLTTALAQAAFAALVLVTGIRYAHFLALPDAPPGGRTATGSAGDEDRGMSVRELLGIPFVALILGYQVFSAVASQLSDYLVYERAAAQYASAADLAGFLAVFTAVMNVVSIAFLALLAGPLMRRYGLRFGINANPVVLTVGAVGMVVVLGLGGAASFALLLTVSAVRILDIALSDGTTRTSINAMYQVLPPRTRLAAQTTIEGMGVPVAIALSGALVFALNAMPDPLTAVIVATVLVFAVWVWVALVLHRAYGPALVDALRRPELLGATDLDAVAGDTSRIGGLLASADPRTARVGLDLAALTTEPLVAELQSLADDPRPEVRLTALDALVATGDDDAVPALTAEARHAVTSPDPSVRARAAHAAEALDGPDRVHLLTVLLADDSSEVRCAALSSVTAGDRELVGPVVAAVDDPATTHAAVEAVRRLGDGALSHVEEALRSLATDGSEHSRRHAMRLLRGVSNETERASRLLSGCAAYPDREVGRVALQRLARPDPADPDTARSLDGLVAADLEHATRVLSAVVALSPATGAAPDDGAAAHTSVVSGDGPLTTALGEELDLLRERVVAGLVARYGSTRLGPVAAGLESGDGSTALALEALEVVLGPSDAARLAPLLDGRVDAGERLRRLGGTTRGASTEPAVVLTEIVADRDGVWRSPWVRACAVRAASYRGLSGSLDLDALRALADPIVDEELDRAPRTPSE